MTSVWLQSGEVAAAFLIAARPEDATELNGGAKDAGGQNRPHTLDHVVSA